MTNEIKCNQLSLPFKSPSQFNSIHSSPHLSEIVRFIPLGFVPFQPATLVFSSMRSHVLVLTIVAAVDAHFLHSKWKEIANYYPCKHPMSAWTHECLSDWMYDCLSGAGWRWSNRCNASVCCWIHNTLWSRAALPTDIIHILISAHSGTQTHGYCNLLMLLSVITIA